MPKIGATTTAEYLYLQAIQRPHATELPSLVTHVAAGSRATQNNPREPAVCPKRRQQLAFVGMSRCRQYVTPKAISDCAPFVAVRQGLREHAMRQIGISIVVLLICGCVTPLPLPTYQGAASVKSDKRAEIVVVPGTVLAHREGTTLAVGGAFVPMGGGWNDRDQQYIDFFAKHERDFAGALCSEFERLGMFHRARLAQEESGTPAPQAPSPSRQLPPASFSEGTDARIAINYVKSSFDFVGGNVYTYDVVLAIAAANSDKPFVRTYHIRSDQGASLWKKFNTNGAQAVHRADVQLMDALINDVQLWLKEGGATG